DVGDTGGDASFAFAILDGARCIGDVDGVLANAFAELTEAAAGAAGANDGGVELWEGGAEFLGNDRGKRQDGGRAGDLDGVARLGKSSARTERGQREHGGAGENCRLHGDFLFGIQFNLASRSECSSPAPPLTRGTIGGVRDSFIAFI